MREWVVRLIDWFRRDALERELAEELRFHRHHLERDASATGAGDREAAVAARRRLGNITRVTEDARDRWSIPALDALLQDMRYAVRGLRRAPGFTATVVVTLSLGIGANAAMFNVVDRLMFRPLGLLREPAMVHRVYLESNRDGRPFTDTWVSFARYADLQRWTTSFAQFAAFNERSLAVGAGDAARERRVGAVTASFFGLFAAPPALGRYFTADEDVVPRGADVVVLAHAYWMAEFGGRDVIGQPLPVGNMRATIIGVAPRGFDGVADANPPVAFIPIASLASAGGGMMPVPREMYLGYDLFWGNVLVRRKPGVSADLASADMSQAFQRSWDAERAAGSGRNRLAPREVARPRALVSAVRPGAGPDPSLETRTAVWISGVATIVLLIACANVANLHLARMLRRQRETAVRLSLGAGRSRLLAQALAESGILALIGAAGGLLVAHSGGAAIHRLLVTSVDGADILTDARTLAATAALALGVGVLTGLAPALLAGRTNLASTLRGGPRGGTSRRGRLRAGLLIVQGALSVALLIGATLFVRSLEGVQAMRMGYDADRALIVRRVLRGVELDADARASLRQTLLDRATALPAIDAASWTMAVPLGMTGMRRFFVPGVDSVGRLGEFTMQETTVDYFRAIGTRIVRGRGFLPDDRRGAPNVVVVSESMATVLWPGRDAIGQCMRIGADTMPCTTVVGIAEDIVERDITSANRFHYYLPIEQQARGDAGTMVLRVRGDPAAEADNVRRALQQVMPGTSYVTVQPMQELVERTHRPWRLGATMFGAFGALALIVAAVGLYGVVGYNVTQRMHELGVRIALGARRTDILRLVVGQSVRFTLAGIALGTGLALLASRWLQPLLFEQSARDPVVYGAVAAALLGVAVVASTSPAARAATADPNLALRAE